MSKHKLDEKTKNENSSWRRQEFGWRPGIQRPAAAMCIHFWVTIQCCFSKAKQGWVPACRRAGRCCNITWCKGGVLLQRCFPQNSGERMMRLVINFLPNQILPLSCFAVISFGLVTLHSFPFSREVRMVNLLRQPAAEEPSCWLLASQLAAEGNESSAAGS